MSTTERTAAIADGGRRPRLLPGWIGLLVGAGAAVVGLLPWLVTGARLPLQNLWAVETRPEQMPRVLLPFNQYLLVLVIVVLVTGAAAAGLCARALRPRLPRRTTSLVTSGVVLVQLAALLQTSLVVRAGLSGRRASTVYLGGLVAVSVLAILVGVLALVLVAAAPPGGAVVGLSIGALALGPWLDELVTPFGSVATSAVPAQVLVVLSWVPPVLVGAAVAWAGLRSVGRVVAAGVALLLVWVVPAVSAGLVSATGSRALARHPAEMVRYALEAFTSALTTPALVVPPVVVTLAVAAAGLAGRSALRRHPGGAPPTR